MPHSRFELDNINKSRRGLIKDGATLFCLANIPAINSINESEQNVLWGEYLSNHTNNAVTSISSSGKPIDIRWRLGNSEYPPYPTVRNQTIYVNSGDKVSAINKRTGKSIWDYPNESLVLAPAVDSEFIYFTSTDGDIVSLDQNGGRNWEENVGAHIGPPTIHKNRVYFAGGSQLYSFKKDGSGFQSVDVGELEQKKVVCIGDDHAYITQSTLASSTDQIIRINIEDYSIDTYQVEDVAGIPVYFDSTIITTGKYETAAVSAGSLDYLWTQDPSEPIPSVVSDDKVIVPLLGAVFAYDIQTGEQLWEYPYKRDSGYPAATIAGDGLLLSYGGIIQSIDPTKGLANWDYEFSSETSRSTKQIVPVDDGYLVTYGNELYMLETKPVPQTTIDSPNGDGGTTGNGGSTGGGQESNNNRDGTNPIEWFSELKPLSRIAAIVTAILTAILTILTAGLVAIRIRDGGDE